MKKTLSILSLLISTIYFSQHKELMKALKENQPEKAINIGQTLKITSADSFETNFLLARAYNQIQDFINAQLFIEKAKVLSNKDWQKSWVTVESIQTYYGLGKIAEAEKIYEEAKTVSGTENSNNDLKYWGILLGFDDFYKDWKPFETKNILFHFQSSISDENIKEIASSREAAFIEINSFFQSDLPKKIDFFVWDLPNNYNPFLNKSLGFTNAAFCISHSRTNQSAGHEIAHIISRWKNPKSSKVRFINEGIAVYFDQNKNDKMSLARAINRSKQVSIKKLWQQSEEEDENVLYPISAAFVGFLIKYDKEKFSRLLINQTYENAKIIYGEKLDDLIATFTNDLNSHK